MGWTDWTPSAMAAQVPMIVLSTGVGLFAARPVAARAQVTWAVSGRVVDSQSGAGLPNALVRLDGVGAMLSFDGGLFRFERVPSGVYPLHVEALGYEPFDVTVLVNDDSDVVVALEIRPVEVDGVTVTLRRIDFDGRIVDPRTGSSVADAQITSDQGHEKRSNLFGRFDLDDVFEGADLRLVIGAFGYLPLDTTFIPDHEERYPFGLSQDPVMTRMIDAYVTRLDDRGGDHLYKFRPALNREDLAQLRANTSLQRILESKYPLHLIRRIGCFFLDEREYRFTSDEERVSVLEGTFANDIERVELFDFPGEGRLVMARIYTRRYFMLHVGSPGELSRPSMIVTPGGVLCR